MKRVSGLMLGLVLAGSAVAQTQTAGGPPAALIDVGVLTVDSAFTVFMRKEVPENMRWAALRRLWVLMQLPVSRYDSAPRLSLQDRPLRV